MRRRLLASVLRPRVLGLLGLLLLLAALAAWLFPQQIFMCG